MQNHIKLRFETLDLPFAELIVVARNCVHGKHGLFKAFELLSPGTYELIEVADDQFADAVLVSKQVLRKVTKDEVLKVLEEKVFPYISEGEMFKIDLKVITTYSEI